MLVEEGTFALESEASEVHPAGWPLPPAWTHGRVDVRSASKPLKEINE